LSKPEASRAKTVNEKKKGLTVEEIKITNEETRK
jgi:hypothetical protein